MRRGGQSTADAARTATAARPQADARGVLSYPGYQVAVARRGDTVASVASRVGLNPEQLASFNALKSGDPLREGEVLALPARVAAAPAMTGGVIGGTGATAAPSGVDVTSIATTALDRAAPAQTTPAAPVAASAAPEPVRHRVARGETAFTIARTYNVSAKALADWNGLGSDLTVREGQYLIIPTAAGVAPPNPVAVTTVPGTGSPTPEPPSAKKPLPDEKPQKATETAKGTPPSPDLAKQRTASSAAQMAMPVSGNIIRGYTKKKNDGIDIGTSAGAPVKAASGGTVAAITMDTQQTPIIVIRHEGNLLTVYAGVDAIKVKKGDTVQRGQQIAAVRAGNPAFLHFEVRKGIESVDPMPYLQ
ncbi:MAG: peptidoglycan DD-metalloendopeptidase family protein [Paracoccaceae bacterium]